MRSLFVALVLASLVCCSAATSNSSSLRAENRAHDSRAAIAEVMRQLYGALEQGDAGSLESLITDDAFVFGLEPADTWQGAMVVGERLKQKWSLLRQAGVELRVEDSLVRVGLDSTGQAGWAFDLPRVTALRQGRSTQWIPRVSAHLIAQDGAFRIDALHISLPVPDEIVLAPAASKRLLAPADVAQQIAPEAEQLATVVQQSLEDFGGKIERVIARDEFVQMGTAAAEIFVGGREFKRMIRPQLPSIRRAGYQWQLEGNLRVKLAPDRKSGWAAAVVLQSSQEGKTQKSYPPMRFFWTWVLEDAGWKLSSEHQSLPLPIDKASPASERDLAIWRALRDRNIKQSPTIERPNIGAW